MNDRPGQEASCGHVPARAGGDLTDADILDEISRGNLEHFESFVDRYKNRLFGYIVHRILDAHQAEDLTQEVFLRAFRAGHRGAYLGPASAVAWLFAIANNCVIDFLRSKRSKPLVLQTQLRKAGSDVDPITQRRSKTTDPAAAAMRAEEHSRTLVLLERLPDQQRIVVAMKIYGGLKFAEIAEVLGTNVATVKSRMRYALDKIERMLPDGREGER